MLYGFSLGGGIDFEEILLLSTALTCLTWCIDSFFYSLLSVYIFRFEYFS